MQGILGGVVGENFDRIAASLYSDPLGSGGLQSPSDRLDSAANVFAHEFMHSLGVLHNLFNPGSLMSRDGGEGELHQLDMQRLMFGSGEMDYLGDEPPPGSPKPHVY